MEWVLGGVGMSTGTSTRSTASREDLVLVFGDMFLVFLVLLKKMCVMNMVVMGMKVCECGDGFGLFLRYDGDANAAESKKEVVSFSEMFVSFFLDLVKM